MTAREQIVGLFHSINELSIKEIIDRLGISKQMAHLVVNQLQEQNIIEKLGSPPKTIYRYIPPDPSWMDEPPGYTYTASENEFLDANYLAVTDTGRLLEGSDAFDHWCRSQKLPVEKTLAKYLSAKKRHNTYYNEAGMIDGMTKLKSTKGYDHIWLDQLYYLDFYAIERFGKTRLGTLLYYAKQGQNKFLTQMMMDSVSGRIKDFLKKHRADAVGFIPPTIRREVQLMKFIQTKLNLALPVIGIKKIGGLIPVPQKSLSKLEERIRNADNTFAVTERRTFRHIVLIDDAVGSGSTLNQVAAKLRKKDIAKKITGLAVVGSFKGFDVITDI